MPGPGDTNLFIANHEKNVNLHTIFETCPKSSSMFLKYNKNGKQNKIRSY